MHFLDIRLVTCVGFHGAFDGVRNLRNGIEQVQVVLDDLHFERLHAHVRILRPPAELVDFFYLALRFLRTKASAEKCDDAHCSNEISHLTYFLGGAGASGADGVFPFFSSPILRVTSSSSLSPSNPLIGPFGPDSPPPLPLMSTSGMILMRSLPIASVILSCVKLSPPMALTASLYDSADDLPIARIFSA